MTEPAKCLILACGNPLRGDDGLGPHLAGWAARRYAGNALVRVISNQQWTPELAHDVAHAESVLFLDCSTATAPGIVQLTNVAPASCSRPEQHHLDAASLLALSRQLYGRFPRKALQLTLGAASTELGQQLSPSVYAALPGALSLLETTIQHLLASASTAPRYGAPLPRIVR